MSSSRSIARRQLREELIRAAQVRSAFTLLTMPLTLIATAAGASLLGEAVTPYAQYGVLLLFGVPAIVGISLTRGYCRNAVL